jgi:hypothetical protein
LSNIAKSPEAWRNYSTKVPIRAFRVKRDELKRLYQIIHSKQIEFRDKLLSKLIKMEAESDGEFASRRERVYNAFVTSVSATGLNDEMVHGNNESFFDSSAFPDHLKSILISTKTVPQATLNFIPLCNVTLFLDFSRPPLFDFSRLPTFPTPNESNFEIAADDETWFAATKARLSEFFTGRKTSTDWLHRAGIYDVLLLFLGIPIAIWLDFRLVGSISAKTQMSPFIIGALYVYVFIAAIVLFRLLFAYSRWVFPKVELDSELTNPLRHRGLWGAVLIGLSISLMYDLLKYMWS